MKYHSPNKESLEERTSRTLWKNIPRFVQETLPLVSPRAQIGPEATECAKLALHQLSKIAAISREWHSEVRSKIDSLCRHRGAALQLGNHLMTQTIEVLEQELMRHISQAGRAGPSDPSISELFRTVLSPSTQRVRAVNYLTDIFVASPSSAKEITTILNGLPDTFSYNRFKYKFLLAVVEKYFEVLEPHRSRDEPRRSRVKN